MKIIYRALYCDNILVCPSYFIVTILRIHSGEKNEVEVVVTFLPLISGFFYFDGI